MIITFYVQGNVECYVLYMYYMATQRTDQTNTHFLDNVPPIKYIKK